MKNIGVKIITSILLIVFLISTTNVYAANDSFETTLVADKTQAKAGDNIIITIGLSNISIESGEKGIGAYTGSIKFDSSVLEYVSTNGTDKWDAPFYENGLITSTTKDGKVVTTQQNIGIINFKVKEDAKLGETTIELENFSGSTGGMTGLDVPTGDKSVKIAIVGDDSSGDNSDKDDPNKDDGNNNGGNGGNSGNSNDGNGANNGNNNNGGNSNNATNKSSNTNKNQNTSVNNSQKINTREENTKKGVLPKTGNSNLAMIIVIVVGILLSVILYISFRKMKNDKY